MFFPQNHSSVFLDLVERIQLTPMLSLRSFMETDPKGQLGGLEIPDATRKRLALESQTFRCPTCARTNKEIMKECEEEAAALGTASADDKEVPSELKMGWKDEMDGTAVMDHKKLEPGDKVESDGETARLAEGFVQTGPAASSSAPSAPAAAVPEPRGDMPRPERQPATASQRQRASANNGVPWWLDQLIVVLFVILVAVVLHRIFST